MFVRLKYTKMCLSIFVPIPVWPTLYIYSQTLHNRHVPVLRLIERRNCLFCWAYTSCSVPLSVQPVGGFVEAELFFFFLQVIRPTP